MRRCADLARQRIRRHISDVPIAFELNPGPTVRLVVDGDDFAEQRLGLQPDIPGRAASQRHGSANDLSLVACSEVGRSNLSAE